MSRQSKHITALQEPACAKINLTLHITGKRNDGFHTLKSLVVFAQFGDMLSAIASDEISLTISGPFAGELSNTDNLVIKAAQALADACGAARGAALHLEKNLPPASGMGGGSADAAATLRILQKLWGINLSADELQRLALKLGADVPVCLAQSPAIMRGIGEKLEPVSPFPTLPIVLVNPGVHVSTPDVFKALNYDPTNAPGPAAPPPELISGEVLLDWLPQTRNDLMAPAINLSPSIVDALDVLNAANNCHFARMSGSGATCFGLYPDMQSAKDAAQTIQNANPGWWVQATTILPAVIPAKAGIQYGFSAR